MKNSMKNNIKQQLLKSSMACMILGATLAMTACGGSSSDPTTPTTPTTPSTTASATDLDCGLTASAQVGDTLTCTLKGGVNLAAGYSFTVSIGDKDVCAASPVATAREKAGGTATSRAYSCVLGNTTGTATAAVKDGTNLIKSSGNVGIALWKKVQPATSLAKFNSIATGGGKWVAVGVKSIYTSADGVTWAAATGVPAAQQSAEWYQVIHDGTRFIAVGQVITSGTTTYEDKGYALYSTDGNTWTAIYAGGNAWVDGAKYPVALNGVTVGGGKTIVMGGGNSSAYSVPDVTDQWANWTWAGDASAGSWDQKLAYDTKNSKVIAVASKAGSTGALITAASTVAANADWTVQTTTGAKELLGVACSSAWCVSVGKGGSNYYSGDATAWTAGGSSTHELRGVASIDSAKFIAVGNNGSKSAVLLTTDYGKTWADKSDVNLGDYLRGVACTSTQCIAVSESGGIVSIKGL